MEILLEILAAIFLSLVSFLALFFVVKFIYLEIFDLVRDRKQKKYFKARERRMMDCKNLKKLLESYFDSRHSVSETNIDMLATFLVCNDLTIKTK